MRPTWTHHSWWHCGEKWEKPAKGDSCSSSHFCCISAVVPGHQRKIRFLFSISKFMLAVKMVRIYIFELSPELAFRYPRVGYLFPAPRELMPPCLTSYTENLISIRLGEDPKSCAGKLTILHKQLGSYWTVPPRELPESFPGEPGEWLWIGGSSYVVHLPKVFLSIQGIAYCQEF